MYINMTEILRETTYLYQAFKKSFRSCQLSTDSFEYISHFETKKKKTLIWLLVFLPRDRERAFQASLANVNRNNTTRLFYFLNSN
jgi:hypothetical protein